MIRMLTAGLLISLSWAGGVAAQEAFPTRPINLVSPYPPGGAADLTARPLAPALEKALGQPVIVVNRTGAGGAVGTQFVSQAPADGYTLVITVFSICTIPEADRVAGRNPRFTKEQFVPIGRLNADPLLLIVHPSTPYKTVKQLVADVKKRPNDVLFVSAGPYSVAHMGMEIFQQAAELKFRHLPTTGGGPAMTAIVAGHAFVSALSTGAVTPQANAGKLRILANTGVNRLPAFPDIPTLKELGYDVEVYLWVGMFARKEVPAQALDVVRKAVKQAAADPQFTNALNKMQMPPAYLDADAFQTWWDKDCERLSGAIRRMPQT